MIRALALAAAFAWSFTADAAAIVLSGGTVIDGYGNAPIPNGMVVIDGERILAVGGRDLVAIPEGAEVISTEGMTVLPGLWDMQVRTMRLGHGDSARWNETYAPLAERVVMPLAAKQLLHAGVTSARDAGAPLEAATRVRERIRENILPGPNLYVSGPVLRKLAPAGTETWQWEVESADDARAKVRQLAAANVDYVLLAELEMWSEEELTAAVSEARIHGLPVHVIAERATDVERGAAMQVDGFLGAVTGTGDGPLPDGVMQALNQRLAAPAARALSWSPAISALLNLESLRTNAEPLDDPATTEALPPLVTADILGSLASLDRVSAAELPAARVPSLCDRLRQLQDTKLALLLGSDAGVAGHLHSRATWQEIDFWVRECGVPAMRAIQAATHDAAAVMGVGHETGSIAPGKIADIIAVRGDVLRNPALLQFVDVVIKRGRRIR